MFVIYKSCAEKQTLAREIPRAGGKPSIGYISTIREFK